MAASLKQFTCYRGIMSGIDLKRLDRSAVPVQNQHLVAAMTNAPDGERYLSFPTIDADGTVNCVDQCIAKDRPLTENFVHANVMYLPKNTNASLPVITIKPSMSNPGQFIVDSYTNMSYYLHDTSLLTFGPAGLISSMTHYGIPTTFSGTSLRNGSPGEAYIVSSGSTDRWFLTDVLGHSNGSSYSRSEDVSTNQIDHYMSVHYLINATLNNGASFQDHKVNWTLNGSGTAGMICGNDHGLTFNEVSNELNSNPYKFKCVQFHNDSDAFSDYFVDDKYMAYIRSDLCYKNFSGYIFAHMPYVTVDLSPLKSYDSAFPNASITFGLQYNAVTQGVANDPAKDIYGMIYDNDKYRKSSRSVDIRCGGDSQAVTAFTTEDFTVDCRAASAQVMSVRISPRNVTQISHVELLIQHKILSRSTYSGSLPDARHITNEDITQNYTIYSYGTPDLATNVKIFSDVKIRYEDKYLHFTVVKHHESTGSGQKKLTFNVISKE
jgi:hypothetical protein